MADDFAIKVEKVSKSFKLPHEKQSSLKSALINFHKRGFEEQHVLENISFEIKKGEFFGIVGRNGSGKSTLLKLLAGIYSPDNGHINVRGKLTPFIELGVGFNPELTGRENVFLNGALLGFNRSEMAAMYEDIVKFAELERFMDQKLKNFSSGMQVRLAFSIAIRVQSDILLLDEVLAVGDEAFQRKCQNYFTDLKRAKKTVILVTHDMTQVEKYCDRALLIEAGQIAKEGEASVVAHTYSDLFNIEIESTTNDTKPKDENRWGDGRYRIIKKAVTLDNPTVYNAQIKIDFTVKCQNSIDDDMIVAYALKDDLGQKLFGDKVKSSTLRKMTKGTQQQFSFTFPNILNKGRYFIDLSVYAPGEGVFTDCWLDCLSFTTKTKGVEGYPVVVNGSFDEK